MSTTRIYTAQNAEYRVTQPAADRDHLREAVDKARRMRRLDLFETLAFELRVRYNERDLTFEPQN